MWYRTCKRSLNICYLTTVSGQNLFTLIFKRFVQLENIYYVMYYSLEHFQRDVDIMKLLSAFLNVLQSCDHKVPEEINNHIIFRLYSWLNEAHYW